MDHKLTKSKITTGIECHKRLWFDIHCRIKKNNFNFERGNVFGEKIKAIYGKGYDLTGRHDSEIIKLTQDAMNDPNINIIYEGAFLYSQTLVRTDVLIRMGKEWKLIEVKSSASVQERHLKDITVQYYILKNLNLPIGNATIAYLNKDFIYKGDDNYKNIIIEEDVKSKIDDLIIMVPQWINDLLPLTEKKAPEPMVKMGDHCKGCNYIERCESKIYDTKVEIPISIIPFLGKKLQNEWVDKKIYDLRDLPESALKNPQHLQIQKCHKEEIEWISKELINQIDNYSWPRYFFDVETIMQCVPLIKNSKPNDQFPFQFSLHKWESQNQILTLEDSQSFLEFTEDNMERRFLLSLIEKLGDEGPIFAHNSSTEIKAIEYLSKKPNCLDLKPSIDKIILRFIDTLKMMKSGFYNIAMEGSYSLKDIIKALPVKEEYNGEGEGIGDGGTAMIKWFEYTKTITNDDQKRVIEENLVKYCAQDTLNLYHLFNYITSEERT